jgi:hypothetical protein
MSGRCAEARSARLRLDGPGWARQAALGPECQGRARPGPARRGKDWRGRYGLARRGSARRGETWQDWPR